MKKHSKILLGVLCLFSTTVPLFVEVNNTEFEQMEEYKQAIPHI